LVKFGVKWTSGRPVDPGSAFLLPLEFPSTNPTFVQSVLAVSVPTGQTSGSNALRGTTDGLGAFQYYVTSLRKGKYQFNFTLGYVVTSNARPYNANDIRLTFYTGGRIAQSLLTGPNPLLMALYHRYGRLGDLVFQKVELTVSIKASYLRPYLVNYNVRVSLKDFANDALVVGIVKLNSYKKL
jgi:hypothetical protein